MFTPHLLQSVCFAASNHSATLATSFHKHEVEKFHTYKEYVHEVEHGSFIPLVSSTSDGIGKAATTTYKRLPLILWLWAGFAVVGVLLAPLVDHVHQGSWS